MRTCVHQGQTMYYSLSLLPECPRGVWTLETMTLRAKDESNKYCPSMSRPQALLISSHFPSYFLESPASTQSSVLVPDTHTGMGSSVYCPKPVPFPKSGSWLWLQLSTYKEAAIHRGGHPSLWLSGGQHCLLQAENQHARANDNE